MSANYDELDFDATVNSTPREIHPRGIWKSAPVDIIDLPQQKNGYYDPTKKGSKPFIDQIKIVWESAARKTDGTPFRISRTFSKSLYDGSNGGPASALHKLLSTWLGADYTGRFVAKQIAQLPAVLVIVHETKDKKTKAKIESVMPDESGEPYVPTGTYKRWVPKEQYSAPAERDDDEVPF